MHIRRLRTATVAAIIAVAALSRPLVIGAEKPEHLIIKCTKPCAGAIGAVAALGGETTFVYDNVDAIAATVPASRVRDLTAAVGADAVRKDGTVSLPPREVVEGDGLISASEVSGDAIAGFVGAQPANYNYNNSLTNAAPLHAAGAVGENVVVAVIDSGTVFSPVIAPTLPALAGTVIGGENFVPLTADPVTSATSRLNDWHGTAVGTMIAAHAYFAFISNSRLANTMRLNAPSSIVDCPNAAFPGCPLNASVIPMFGTAPAAKIYALKVFSSRGGGAPESRIIAAMDRAITLRRNFNEGASTAPVAGTGTENDPFKYDALNIKVVNMSIGGPTLFAGGDLEDQLTKKMLDVGITIVVAAGNSGFAAMTGGSPGTGLGSLTVGASSTPVHERVLRELQQPGQPLGYGKIFRPFDGVQTAFFSSRGPTADGRFDPELSANGFASYTNVFIANGNAPCGAPGAVGCSSRIVFVSGTSLSSPTVAGAAALLRGAVPSATATETRNALVRGANPEIVSDGSGRIDQGAGFLDVSASLALLDAGMASDDISTGGTNGNDEGDDEDEVGRGGQSVAGNLKRLGIRTVQFSRDRFTAQVNRLKPGQVKQFYVPSDIFTNQLVVKITNIDPELEPPDQNLLFGDDLFVMGVDAPTSFAVHRIENPPGSEGVFINADSTFTIDNPQTGLVRIALQGDWTNAGRVSARLTIDRKRSLPTLPSAIGRIRQDDLVPYRIDVPAGVSQGVIELFWLQNWGRYPTNDLDMLIIDPAGDVVVDDDGNPRGATLDSPERVVLTDPAPGTWTVLVNGFTIWPHGHFGKHPGKDTYTLTATANGRRLRIKK